MAISYDVNFINPFLEAVINVLETMANVKVKPGKPYINKHRTAVGDVTGIINISGHTNGVISLTLSKDAVLTIVNNMLFESYTEINDEIADAVGELTNMISGQARIKLSEQGQKFQAGTPKIIVGKGKKLEHIPNAPILAIPFTLSSGGDLVVEASFET
jgi:chemotaxis protein CheX